MTNFTIHTKETAPESAKPILEVVQGKFGFVPNLLATLAESPNVLQAYLNAFEATSNGTLSTIEQKVVQIATSQVNGCEYCVAADSTISDMLKMPSDVINAVREDREIADKKLEALRQFTKTVVKKQGFANETDVNTFLNSGYSKGQVLEVVLSVVVKILGNYANHIVNSPLDKSFAARAIDLSQHRKAS